VQSIKLVGANAQFTLSNAPTLPYPLQVNGSAGDTVTINVGFTASTTFSYDTLTVVSGGGTISAIVQESNPPQIVIVPTAGDAADSVNFNLDATGGSIALPNSFTGSKTFQIQNVGTGPLIIQGVAFRDTGNTGWPAGAPYPYFSVTPPATGTTVQPAASIPVQVTFTDSPNGGPSGPNVLATELQIASNDPSWPPPVGKTVLVSAKTPCNPAPVALATGPTTATKATSVTLGGDTSYDLKPDPTGACDLVCAANTPAAGCPAAPITHWEWSLQTVPTNAGGSVSLTPNGLGTAQTTQLQLGTCSPCSDVVRLYVYDDTPATSANPNGLKSNYTDFTVNVQ
jgi:hypothetical protein